MRLTITFLFMLVSIVVALAVAAAGYLLFGIYVTTFLPLDLAVTSLLFWLVAGLLTWYLARSMELDRPARAAILVTAVAFVAFALLLSLPTLLRSTRFEPAVAGPEVTVALGELLIPLDTAEPRADVADLEALGAVLAGHRVVALGEATHGTHEFFTMKHRLIAYLVAHAGFRHFGLETDAGRGAQLDAYIQGQNVQPREVLYWPWATEEFIAMLDWMRAYNTTAAPADRLTLHGIDPRSGERDRVMAENVLRLLETERPESKIVLWAHNGHVSAGEGWMGAYLRDALGEDLYLLGFEFDRGRFTSRTGAVHTFEVGPATATYYAHTLAPLESDIFFLDFETARNGSPALAAWLDSSQDSHHLAEMHLVFRLFPGAHTLSQPWPSLYDGIIFVETSTPSRVLSGTPD